MTAALVNRPNIPYGARQFQEYIGKSTYRAFAATLSLFALVGLVFVVANALNQTLSLPNVIPSSVTIIDYIELPKTVATPSAPKSVAAPSPSAPSVPALKNPSVANFKPVPVITPAEQVTFEPAAPAGNSNAVNSNNSGIAPVGGNGEVPSNNSNGGTQSGTAETPGMWDFAPVEKEPVVNYAALTQNLVYPDMAKRAHIEGKVQLRALIGADGKVVEAVIIDADNQMLGKAAMDAVLKTRFTPAEQNGQPVNCWISIPVDFKLR